VKFVTFVVAWSILLVLCWPLALVVPATRSIGLVIALPFRLVGNCVGAVLALVRALLFLPARILGYRGA